MGSTNGKSAQPKSRVVLVLEGDPTDITDVVQLALAGGLIAEMKSEVVTGAPVLAAEVEPAKPYADLADLTVGTRVVARFNNKMYDVTAGQVGRVIEEGSRHKAPTIEWDNGERAKCAASCLRLVTS